MSSNSDFEESDKLPVPNKIDYDKIEKPPKKPKGPAKIIIPSLADFEDEDTVQQTKRHPSQKGSGLIGMLPPPKGSVIATKTNSMIPHVLSKKPVETKPVAPKKTTISLSTPKEVQKPKAATSALTSLLSNYNSDSDEEDEKETESGMDFFSLSTPITVPNDLIPPMNHMDVSEISPQKEAKPEKKLSSTVINLANEKKLSSTVMNLAKEEIIMKNKAEVGPKLPVPEQEFHVDSQGNVAFDEKAIEYLCGKRGVKRKNEFQNVDIVEISGEDMKPDERDWLVKALTEEQVHRPLSIGAGPSGQSKKKHQITYLAHQAKAMELELKNQWANNKASRQATRSKYGF